MRTPFAIAFIIFYTMVISAVVVYWLPSKYAQDLSWDQEIVGKEDQVQKAINKKALNHLALPAVLVMVAAVIVHWQLGFDWRVYLIIGAIIYGGWVPFQRLRGLWVARKVQVMWGIPTRRSLANNAMLYYREIWWPVRKDYIDQHNWFARWLCPPIGYILLWPVVIFTGCAKLIQGVKDPERFGLPYWRFYRPDSRPKNPHNPQ